MVNYRRILWELAVVCAILAFAASAPTPDCTEDRYDQRQNGSENIRVHVDGLLLAVMPAESIVDTLLSALPDLNDIIDLNDYENLQKPKPPASSKPPNEPTSPLKPDEKPHEALHKPQSEVEKPLSEVEKPQSEVEKPQLEADKPALIESLPKKSPETPLSDVSLNSEVVKKRKHLTDEQKKARIKKIFGNLLQPFMRRNRHH